MESPSRKLVDSGESRIKTPSWFQQRKRQNIETIYVGELSVHAKIKVYLCKKHF